MRQFLFEARARFRSAVPPFFRKLQIVGASVATLGTALQALSLPQSLLAGAGYIAVAGGVMVAVAQFAEKNIIAERDNVSQ
jgi:hypothetical protein